MIAPLVPLVCFLLLCHLARRRGADRCAAILAGAICWGVTVTGLTELLSALHALTFWGALTGWLIVLCVLAAAARDVMGGAGRLLTYGWEKFLDLNFWERVQLCAVAGLLCIVAFAGLFSAPSNWDSMTYRLVRVAHWMQDRSVVHYPAVYTPQLYQPPWAEFAILNLQLLSGGDRLAFTIQWTSFALCLVGVWSIAGRLGADVRGQVLAVVVAATLPQAVLQAPSTQNNLALALWLICFARFLLDYRPTEAASRLPIALLCGAAVGLAMLTKGTAYPLAAPMVVWFAVLTVRHRNRGTVLAAAAAIVVALLLNVAHWSRNYQAFNSPLMPRSEISTYRTDSMSPTLLISNLSRNLVLHFRTGSSKVNHWIERAIDVEHHLLGVDVSDPQITAPAHGVWMSYAVFRIRPYIIDEDSTGNPFHLLLFIFTCGWAALSALRRRQDRLVLVYTTAVVTGYVLFCASIKWQPFDVRLDLPLFVAAAPATGLALARIARERITSIISLLLLLLTVPPLLCNPSHPLVARNNIFNLDRESEYFLNRPELAAPYIQAADFLASQQCNSIGLAMEPNDYEYPLWILMHNRLGRWPMIQLIPTSGTPDAWQGINCVVILQPQLRDRVFALEPSGPWQVRIFGGVTVQSRR
jgi:4-amino-4-deoxy-L-arabinose transferase-like glycosyltransferase